MHTYDETWQSYMEGGGERSAGWDLTEVDSCDYAGNWRSPSRIDDSPISCLTPLPPPFPVLLGARVQKWITKKCSSQGEDVWLLLLFPRT